AMNDVDLEFVVGVLTALDYGERRGLLLTGLDDRMKGGLPTLVRPGDQARSDVHQLLKWGVLPVLLKNAVKLTYGADRARLARLAGVDVDEPVVAAATVALGGGSVGGKVRKILFLGASPIGIAKLSIELEAEAIRRELRLAGSDIEVASRFAATFEELQRALLDVKPDLVHVICHGQAGDLIFMDAVGQRHKVPGRAVVRALRGAKGLKGAVLLACDSAAIAQQLPPGVPAAIGLKEEMSDNGARAYAVGFYLALARGLSFEECHEQGQTSVMGKGLDEDEVPVLFGGGPEGPVEEPGHPPEPLTRGVATLTVNAWPAPDLHALGVYTPARQARTPPGRWQVDSWPGSPDWQQARDGLDEALSFLDTVKGPVDIFASGPYGLAADLGLKVADLPMTPRFWQAHGPPGQQKWRCFGQAQNHGTPLLRASGEAAVAAGEQVALFVSITQYVRPDEAAEGLASASAAGARIVRLEPGEVGFSAVVDEVTAQQAAYDLQETLRRLSGKASALHVFYVGPGAVLMMAAGVLRTTVATTVYDRGRVGPRTPFWPVICFEGGKGRWVTPP
ncbi:MAG: SAVED domain-containing protein, partial [Myxococcales bacterium]|nr:SAVED domain-containing protein [Myxococcales bacterium]